jgi:hypothetical protein
MTRAIEWAAAGYLIANIAVGLVVALAPFWPVLLWQAVTNPGAWRHGRR